MTDIRPCEQKITFTIRHIRPPLDPYSQKGDFGRMSDLWEVSLNGQIFDYYTGIGCRVASKAYGHKEDFDRLKNKRLTPEGLKDFLACSRPVPPTMDCVLHGLASDADACEMSFEDWASNLGYDTDSRKALDTYFSCQEAGRKLRKAGIDATKERERLRDY